MTALWPIEAGHLSSRHPPPPAAAATHPTPRPRNAGGLHPTRARASSTKNPAMRRQGLWLPAAALLLLACSSASAAAAATNTATDPPPLRFWIDEFFFAEGETTLLREAVAASGGAAVVAGTTRNQVLQLKSYQQAAKADVLWTGRKVSADGRGPGAWYRLQTVAQQTQLNVALRPAACRRTCFAAWALPPAAPTPAPPSPAPAPPPILTRPGLLRGFQAPPQRHPRRELRAGHPGADRQGAPDGQPGGGLWARRLGPGAPLLPPALPVRRHGGRAEAGAHRVGLG